ncbi:thiamine pyrophosphate-binding protein [Clostridium sp.]|jgi:acetolactate synthase-1/2/3 large subunit|uniref:thiamine pyrophosphate-binding protein n=1 Tax=Clostridium sp. TaxID=1506 RepID=UPI003EE82F2B
MRVADFIFKFLVDKGLESLFMVSGGQAMFLVDAVCQNKDIKVICTHHEQAATMAAEAYGRITGKLGVALVTAGPGSINAMNGLVGGWTDSSPMMVISGQSALSCVQFQQKTNIRQYGVQGINIKPFVESGTKYFVTVDDPCKILYYLQEAYYNATSGRPGPVWIDVPLDIQRMEVPTNLLEEFTRPLDKINYKQLKQEVTQTLELIYNSKRPIFIVGQGVRIAKAETEFIETIEKFNIPTLTSRLGIDLIESENDLYVGRPGNYGERAANFAIQNADLIISVGCRLATALIGHDKKDFGRNSKKVVVDIDKEELEKPDLDITLKINNDAKRFFKELLKQVNVGVKPDFSEWVKVCNNWKKTYPVVVESYKDEKPVNSYYFTDKLSELSSKDDMILVDTGSCFHVACQAWKIKKDQRFLTTGGLSSMGYWAAGIGACIANNSKRTLVITGDGSLQMNIQEFATIKHNNLPIKIFIFNNNGYLLIRFTQKNLMEGRLFGEGRESGVWCPDSLKIAKAYGIKGVRIDSVYGMEEKIQEVLNYDGPVICDVMTPEWQLIVPRVSSEKMPDGSLVSKPYEDMFPFLDREEFLKNIIK